MATTPAAVFTPGHRKLTHDTSRYERLLHDARADRGTLGAAITTATGALLGTVDRPDGLSDAAVQEGMRQARTDVHDLTTEVFARLFNDPARLDAPSADVPIAGPVHDAIDQLPEFEALRQSVQADPDFSAIATASVMQDIADRMQDIADAAEREEEAREQGQPMPGGRSAADIVRAALRKKMKATAQTVNEGKEAMHGLFPGLGDAPPTYAQEDPARMTLAELLIENRDVRDVIRRAGRISRLAAQGKRVRDPRARSEVYGLERGGDVSRILPAELLGLVDPDFEDLSLLAIAERKAMQYRLRGIEVLGRGPIVALIDRSSSMREPNGDPEKWASAAAIALVGQGHKERRPVTVVEFTRGVHSAYRVADGKAVQLDTQDPSTVVAKAASPAAVTYMLASTRSMGGTELDKAMQYGVRAGALDDRADLVLVTDGCAERVSPEVAEALTEAKSRGLRVFALTVNGGSVSAAIEQLADVAVDLDRVEDIGEAIASAIPQT